MRFGVNLGAGASVGGLGGVPDRAAAMGADCVQVFVTSSRAWRAVPPPDDAVTRFRDACARTGVESFVHVTYLVNYATGDDALLGRSTDALRHTLRVADALGVTGVVTHLGSHLGAGFDAVLDRITAALSGVLADGDAAGEKPVLLLENAAGAGGTVGAGIGELERIITGMGRPERVGVCLDTAHLLAAGYEIRTRAGLDEMAGELATLGPDRLRLLHLNDSKTELGSRVDRHENIGDGHIGRNGFAEIVNHPALRHLPGILEVPGLTGHGPDAGNLARLRELVREPAER